MSIEKLKDGDYNLICDGNCGTQKEYFGDNGNWQFFIDQVKKDGWRIYKDEQANLWYHYCPSCRKEKKL